MTVNMITKTSNPFATTSGIDDNVQAVYMDCFDAIKTSTDVYISMYMWEDDNSPNTVNNCNPKQLLDKLVAKIESKEPLSSFEVLFDIDYMNASERDAFQDKLINAGASAFYPKFKRPNRGLSGSPKMHNKTMLFSRLTFPDSPKILKELAGKTIENVVVQASANIWRTQYSQANQVVIYYDNAQLFDYTLDAWKVIKEDLNKIHLTSFKKYRPPECLVDNVKTYALPRDSRNLVKSILKNIDEYRGYTSSKIRIAMGGFSNAQGAKDIAQKLKEIAQTGMDVKLVLRKGKDGLGSDTKAILDDSEVDYILLEKNVTGNTCKIHSKFLLFDGKYKINNVIDNHKIVWAGSLNYTNPALTKNSETLVRIVDDSLHIDLHKSWCELRYTSSLPKVSACLAYGHNQRVYFFHNNQYVRWKPSFGIETINVNQSCRIFGEDGWKGLPGNFKNGIDAALWYSHNKHAYLFKGSKYIKWKPEVGTVGSTRTIGSTGWVGLPSDFCDGIDAVIEHPINKHVYFFKGDKYCKWKPGVGVVNPVIRQIGVNGWQLPPEFSHGIDAALAHPEGNYIYFFKGRSYCKWKPNVGIISPEVRQIGIYGWEGVMF